MSIFMIFSSSDKKDERLKGLHLWLIQQLQKKASIKTIKDKQ
jgi:hypothetical protein